MGEHDRDAIIPGAVRGINLVGKTAAAAKGLSGRAEDLKDAWGESRKGLQQMVQPLFF
jgi:hypothetical protein